MKYQKILIKKDNIVEVQCPKCLTRRTFPASKLGIQKHYVKLKCTCGFIFLVELEFRQKNRKTTNLEGYFFNLSLSSRIGDPIKKISETHLYHDGRFLKPANCQIKSMSKSGVGFITKKPPPHGIETGNELRLIFILDNSAKTEIIKKVVVRYVKQNYIGCEFVEKDKYDTALGFYFLS